MKNMATMGFLGIERKFYDTMLANQAILAPTDAAGGELDPSASSMMTTPAQGDGEQNRDGKQIAMLYLEIKGSVQHAAATNQAAALPGGVTIYLAAVLDSQTNGAQMSSEDCFKNLSADASGAPNPLRNLKWNNRFRILKQQKFDLSLKTLAPSNDATHWAWGGNRRNFHWYIPLKGLKVNFKDTTADVANVVDNSIHMIGFANNTSLTPLITYNARLRFVG